MDAQYAATSTPEEADRFFGLPSDFLRLRTDKERTTVERLLNTAVDWAEAYTNRVLRITSFTAKFDCFTRNEAGRYYVEIKKSPLVDVTALRVFEDGEASATAVLPTVVFRSTYSRVFLPKAITLDIDGDLDYPIEVDFRAGYSPAPAAAPLINLPSSVRTGIAQHVTYMFENRGDVAGDFDDAVPDEVKQAYMPIRIPRSVL